MSSLLQHAKAELRAAGLFDTDADYDGMVAHNVVSLIETFVAAGHSGGSAELALAAFDKLARHLPITPLTGEDDEWEDRTEMSDRPMWQNKRCSSVFKDKDGQAWIVRDVPQALGAHTGENITFPYTVK